MRTAEEILDKNLGGNFLGSNTKESVINAINEGRKEAIEAAYEFALLGNSQAILSLINKLK